MKLIIKNLKQVPYDVDVSSMDITVKELKNEIEKVHGFDATLIKLLFSGAVLDDTRTLASYQIKEESVLIMMNNKLKPKNVPKEEPQQQVQQQPSQQVQQQQPSQQQQQQPPQPQQPKPDYTEQITNLVEMGFIKEEATAAITAAKGNITLAVEFLSTGIPANLPLDDAIPSNTANNSGGATAPPRTQLQQIASFVKVICSQNPAALQQVLMALQANAPELMNLIKDNEEEFKNLLSEPLNETDIMTFNAMRSGLGDVGFGGSGLTQQQGVPQRRNQIVLTKEEFEAVKRLKEMGFDEMEAVQAYIACDKNEELAANFLFDMKFEKGGDGQHGGGFGVGGSGEQGGEKKEGEKEKKEDGDDKKE